MPHEPKRRHSTQRKGERRASIRLNTPRGIVCSNCQNSIMPHTVCRKCGFYNGRQVLTIKQAKEKAQTK